MKKRFELKQEHHHAINKAEAIANAAEGREMTESESRDFTTYMTAAKAIGLDLKKIEAGHWESPSFPKSATVLVEGGRRFSKVPSRVFSAEYSEGFFDYVSSNGANMSAALYEGAGSAGGYAVPIEVDSQIVPLAPTDTGVRKLATVIPTSSDIKVPRHLTLSTASAKAESGATFSSFTESEPTLDQFTLSAYMAGLVHNISWELAQDVPSFQQFAVNDALLAQAVYEENLYVNGTGVGQAQGLIGNTGAGIAAATPDSSGNLLSLDSTFDVLGTLKGSYHEGASWLMQRSTAILLRKAQTKANLFEAVFTRVGEQDYLHGYPVEYSTAMPVVAAGATPVLFGNFRAGYCIGDRGGSGVNVKVLDQPLAVQGILQLLFYRRTDGRVRRSEAIQAITLHA